MAVVFPEDVRRAYQRGRGAGGKTSMAPLRNACDLLEHVKSSGPEMALGRMLVGLFMEKSFKDLTRAIPWNQDLDAVREHVLELGLEVLDAFVEMDAPEADSKAILLHMNELLKQYDSFLEELNETDRRVLWNQLGSQQ